MISGLKFNKVCGWRVAQPQLMRKCDDLPPMKGTVIHAVVDDFNPRLAFHGTIVF